jgi:hypothetical protein
MGDTPPLDVVRLALALHEWEGEGTFGGELNCFSCAQWLDDNTPNRQPKPGDVCWESAAFIAREYDRLDAADRMGRALNG